VVSSRTSLSIALVLLSLAAASCVAPPEADWTTDFERSEGLRTPRYEATIDFCRRLAEASPRLRLTEFGTSPQGRALPLLIADRRGRFTPEEVHVSANAVVLVQACIHAGECCGKDAGLMLLRDLTVAGRYPELLDNVTLLFIPIFNVDGHERFGPYNRINQNGPEEMGWRVTAQNLNLNRDFLKADTPEMQAWLRLFNRWRPDFIVDIHSTDGADYQYPISYGLEIRGSMAPAPTAWTRAYLAEMELAMAAAGFPLAPYVVFRDWHDPRSGLVSWVAPPRLSQGYTALHNRPGLLVETHMLKDYPIRVAATYELVKQSLRFVNEDPGALREAVREADRHTASPAFRERHLPVRFESTPDSVMIDFLGVEYEEVQSDLTGGRWFRFGKEPQNFRIPFFDQQRPAASVELPEAYLLPAEWTEVIDRLQLHGVQVRRLASPATLTVQSYRFRDAEWQRQPYEGRHPVEFALDPITEERTFAPGSAVVDIRQPAAKVAAHILEPEAPDSYAYWGFFDAVFSRVEYVESYVIEEMAERMIEENPDLARELAEAKAADAEFAGNPWAIRYWFYQRSPYYDHRHNIYPVGKIVDREVVESLPVEGVDQAGYGW